MAFENAFMADVVYVSGGIISLGERRFIVKDIAPCRIDDIIVSGDVLITCGDRRIEPIDCRRRVAPASISESSRMCNTAH